MILIGDIGGFAGAIVIFPSFLMSWYSSKIFTASVLQEIPVDKSKKKSKKGKNSSFMQSKL